MKSGKKATFLSSLGAGLEYYDFIIYGMMAGYLSGLFFPESDLSLAYLKTFSVFAVGYLARPFGGVFFGMMGDAFGRKKAFLAVMFLMSFSSLCIGFLPTYSSIGSAAGVCLIVLRIFQGLSFGAELPGAITVVCEHSEKERQGERSGFVISSVGIGSTFASFILFLMTSLLSKEEIESGYWRIPFLLGGGLAIASYYIRKHLQETPEFCSLQSKQNKISFREPLFQLFKNYKTEVVLGIGMSWLVASLVIFSLYLPAYLTQYFYQTSSDVYFAMTLGMVWSSLILPFCGRIADRFSKRNILFGTSLAFFPLGFLLFYLLAYQLLSVLILFMIVYQTVIAFLMSSYFPLLVQSFPTSVRYTGVALCYNVTYSILGTLPLFMTALISLLGAFNAGLLFLLFSASITCLSVVFSKQKQSAQKIPV